LVLISVTVFSCTQSKAQNTEVVQPTELQNLIKEKKDLQLIDVRTSNEFKDGHLKGASLIDYYQADFKVQLDKLDKDKPIAVYCALGGRSGQALKIIVELGFKEAYDLAGGIKSWKGKGLEVIKD